MNLPIPKQLHGYTGAKTQQGVYQFIINHIPKHSLRAELFLGSGAISAHIGSPHGEVVIGSDLDPHVVHAWQADEACRWLLAFNYDYLKTVTELKKYYTNSAQTFLYCDPPYLKETRASTIDLYRKEFEEVDHANFLTHAKFWTDNVMISHYPCELYNDMLQGWVKKEFTSQTHAGPKTDCIYMNYNINKMQLHTTKYLGNTFTKRQMIARKAERWTKQFAQLHLHEKQYLVDTLIGQVK